MLLHYPNKAASENTVNTAILEGKGTEHKKRNKSTSSTVNTTGQTETDVFNILEDLLEWTETNLLDLPHISKDIFSLRLLNYLINTCSNTVTLVIADTSFIGLSLEFANKVLSNIERSQEETPNEFNDMADEKQDISSDFEDIISACLKPICRYVRNYNRLRMCRLSKILNLFLTIQLSCQLCTLCFRLTKEITEWFFNTQHYSLNGRPMQNANAREGNDSISNEVSLIITMAVPSLIDKMFEIIKQMHISSKDESGNFNNLFDGTKKCFASILYYYETNGIKDDVHWERIPPIDTIIRLTKTVLWKDILKVSSRVFCRISNLSCLQ